MSALSVQDGAEDTTGLQYITKALRILRLVQAVQRTPFEGAGQPEPLKHDLSGCWSRGIDREHRLVYQVQEDKIRILSCRYHY